MVQKPIIINLRAILGQPSVSRGFYVGLTAWLTVPLLMLLNGASALLTTLGDDWAHQGEPWSAPMMVINIVFYGFWTCCALPLSVIGFMWSLSDLIHHRKCSLLGMVLAVGWPLLVVGVTHSC